MPTIIDAIESRISTLDQHEKRLSSSLSKMPEGSLFISKQRGYSRFYHVIDGKKVYLNRNNTRIISVLAQKLFKEKTLKAVLEQKKALSDCLDRIKNSDANIECVYSSLDEEIQMYVKQDESSDDGFVRKWKEEKYASAGRTDKHVFETMGKDMVRSKSELIIADRLFQADIPYRYEQLLVLDIRTNLFYYPDFTILNKRTHKIVYWEHMGLVGDKKYCSDNLVKLDDYMSHGIIQGKNLILTFECDGKPISTAYVNKLIKEFLV